MAAATLRIGTRGSDLALAQTRTVAELLRQRHAVETTLVVVTTAGDRDHTRALHDLPGVGFFARELQRALADGTVDLVVHSLKDLPVDEPEGLALAAVLARSDPADVLLARPEVAGRGGLGLRAGATVGTSSLRRAAQALAAQPDVRIAPLRGNVPTRLRRLRDGEVDAVVLAMAGLQRLSAELGDLELRRLDPAVFVPAPGQGALAVEVRADDTAARAAAVAIDDPATATATSCERMLLRALGGGCHLPLGALAEAEPDGLVLRAALGEIDPALTHATLRSCQVRGADARAAAAAALKALGAGGRP